MTTAREIMTSGAEFVKTNQTASEAAEKMASLDIGALPICDDDGKLQGMVTDRDIAVKVVAAGKDPQSTSVGDLIDVTEVVTIGADDSVEEALATMKRYKVRRLPVIDGTDLVGVVSQGDVATHLPEDKV